MAGKTNTESIRDLERALAILEARLDQTREDIERLRSDQSKATDNVSSIDRRLAVLESQPGDLTKRHEEWDRRRWGVWLTVIGSVIGFIISLALLLFKKP